MNLFFFSQLSFVILDKKTENIEKHEDPNKEDNKKYFFN